MVVFLAIFLVQLQGFQLFKGRSKSIVTRTKIGASSTTWQEDVDKILDVDTNCDSRRDVSVGLFQKIDDIRKDISNAVKDKNLDVLAPSTLTYGKNLKQAQAFRKQLATDILPELLAQTLPKLIFEAPKIAQKLIEKGPNVIVKRGESLLETIREVSGDASALQATVDSAKQEFANIFRSTPAGLYTPPYNVIKSTDVYEIRDYAAFAVAFTSMSVSESSSDSASNSDDVLISGSSFNTLAGYIFGENVDDSGKSLKMSMTVPVIMSNGKMEFILPASYSDITKAPSPSSDKVKLEEVSPEILAVKTFTGIATNKEIAKQRALLEDALIAEGLVYDNLSFKTLQYNPPQTLPWVRRNEVCLKIILPAPILENDVIATVDPLNPDFATSPEAGD